jgi:N-formylglutamate amidohydrolase
MTKNLIATIPHSGEKIPSEAPWLKGLPEEILMCDVDRYVDFLYEKSLGELKIPFVKTQWHRYAADLNRVPEDVDCSSVQGNPHPQGTHSRGFHWVVTTLNQPLIKEPMAPEVHQKLINLVYQPFHQEIEKLYQQNTGPTYHLDLHSMPSVGTAMHRDPGETRADVVISDCHGTSCEVQFRDIVLLAFLKAGFKVAYNWPYYGGKVSEQYGKPQKQQHAIQIELNRALYMDEKSKKLKEPEAAQVQKKLHQALVDIQSHL